MTTPPWAPSPLLTPTSVWLTSTSITTSTVIVLLPAVAVFLLLVTSTLRAASRRKIRGVAHLKMKLLKHIMRSCLESALSWWSSLLVCRVTLFLVKGREGGLTGSDMIDLLPCNQSRHVMSRFSCAWQQEKEKANFRTVTEAPDSPTTKKKSINFPSVVKEFKMSGKAHRRTTHLPAQNKINMAKRKNNDKASANLDTAPKARRKSAPGLDWRENPETGDRLYKLGSKSSPSFLKAIVATFGADFLLQQLCELINTTLHLSDPLLLGFLLNFMEDRAASAWRGYAICLLIMTSNMTQSLLKAKTVFTNYAFRLRIKSAVINSVYRKTLTMTAEGRQKSTVGQAVNLMSVDAKDICHTFCETATGMWTVPVKLLVVLTLLYRLLGPSMIVSVVVLMVMVPVNSLVTRRLTTMHTSIMEHKDHRLKLLTQVINGIKILKMYTWEPSFLAQVKAVRGRELEDMWWGTFWKTALYFYWQVTPYLVSVTALMAYVYTSDDHYLSPSTAFVALSLIDILRGTVGSVPEIVAHLVKVSVSFQRVNDFLNHTDLEDDMDGDVSDEDAISITNGYFSWSSDDVPTLKSISITVKKGSLVAVVGTVGCGKSSLLAACLGDMNTLHGHVSRKGTVAYVPQQAWIQHATLKDNVLFGRPLNQHVYEQCLEDCALQADLDILPAGDNTEIGEKGINLSGGQKQRVSLARAVYSEADLYLLDDPLSAVDSHVGTHIFHKVIGHQGLLAGKTRVLVTHGLQWLPLVDQIVVMAHGHVTQVGTYSQLLSHNGPFTRFLKHHLKHTDHPNDHFTAEAKTVEAEFPHNVDPVSPSPSRCLDGNDNQMDGSDDDSDDASSSCTGSELVVHKLLTSRSVLRVSSQTDEGGRESNTDDQASTEKGDNRAWKDKGRLVEEDEFKVQHVNEGKIIATTHRIQTFQATWNTFLVYGRAVGFGWLLLMLLLYAMQHWALRAGEVTLSQWTDDPQLNNLTSLPPDNGDRLALNQYYLAVYAAFGVIQALCTLSFKMVQLMRQVVVAARLHDNMMSCVLRAPVTFFDTTPVGRIVNRFSNDLHVMDAELTGTTELAFRRVVGGVSKLVVICYIAPVFLLFLLPMAAVFFYVQYWFIPTMRQMERLETKTRSPIYSFFAETLGGTAVIRAFGHQQRFIREFEDRVDLNFAIDLTWRLAIRWADVRMWLVGSVGVGVAAMVAVTCRDTVSPGLAGVLLAATFDVKELALGMVHLVSWVQTEIVSVDRVHEYCTMPVEADWRNKDMIPSAGWPERGEVRVNDLTLRYRDGLDLVLKGLTFHVQAGHRVGIVGRTGAGKSSLTLALFRLIEPAGGVIHIDELATRDLGLHDLRGRLTILPQDPVIFAGSMRMNLDPLAQYSEVELWEALRHAHLGDFVCGLRHGLDHHCGEGGDNFSVGQRQLLCLARALLHKRRVLVLDEATAALDMETDHLIQLTLRQHFAHCTVLTIAHRLHTLMDYDRIMVMDQGQVREYDSPRNLMDTPTSLFRHMAVKAGLLPSKPAPSC